MKNVKQNHIKLNHLRIEWLRCIQLYNFKTQIIILTIQ